MRRLVLMVLAAALTLLCGCAVSQPVWETVEDEPVLAAGSFLDKAYTMAFDIPADAREQPTQRQDVRSYVQRQGDYALTAQTLLASDVDGVIRRLSGYEQSQLQILQTRRFGMQEYQFAWYQEEADGGRLCRADVLMDELCAYALVFQVKEGVGDSYAATAQQVFSSFNLFFDEQI